MNDIYSEDDNDNCEGTISDSCGIELYHYEQLRLLTIMATR